MLFIDLTVEVIGKPEPRDWKNNEGQTMKSYRLNVAQNDGCDVATIRCPQIVYDSVRRGDRAVFVSWMSSTTSPQMEKTFPNRAMSRQNKSLARNPGFDISPGGFCIFSAGATLEKELTCFSRYAFYVWAADSCSMQC